MRNLLREGVDIYRLGLACSTVVFAYCNFVYDIILAKNFILHIIVFFTLPIFGTLLYFIIFYLNKLSYKLINVFINNPSVKTKRSINYPTWETAPKLGDLKVEDLETLKSEIQTIIDQKKSK